MAFSRMIWGSFRSIVCPKSFPRSCYSFFYNIFYGIKWSFPELIGVCPNNDGVFNDELNKFMYAVSDELRTLNNVWRVK